MYIYLAETGYMMRELCIDSQVVVIIFIYNGKLRILHRTLVCSIFYTPKQLGILITITSAKLLILYCYKFQSLGIFQNYCVTTDKLYCTPRISKIRVVFFSFHSCGACSDETMVEKHYFKQFTLLLVKRCCFNLN